LDEEYVHLLLTKHQEGIVKVC